MPGPARALGLDEPGQQPLEEQRLVRDGLGHALVEPGEDEEILDQPVQTLRLRLDVGVELVPGVGRQLAAAAKDLRPAQDRRDRCPQLMGQHPDEGLAHASGLARLRHVAGQEDRGADGTALHVAIVLDPRGTEDREGTQLDPATARAAVAELDRALVGDGAELREPSVGVLEPRRELLVGGRRPATEHVGTGRVGQGDHAVRAADDDGVADGRKDGLQLGRPGSLRPAPDAGAGHATRPAPRRRGRPPGRPDSQRPAPPGAGPGRPAAAPRRDGAGPWPRMTGRRSRPPRAGGPAPRRAWAAGRAGCAPPGSRPPSRIVRWLGRWHTSRRSDPGWAR